MVHKDLPRAMTQRRITTLQKSFSKYYYSIALRKRENELQEF